MMRWLLATIVMSSVGAVDMSHPVLNDWARHSRKVDSKDEHIIDRRAAQQSGYGAPAQESEVVDLHNKEFCVDVSIFQDVVWVERDGEECKTDFVKQCEDKSEEVCAEVHETRCEVCLQDRTSNS